MASVQHRSKHLESAISICLLAILFLIVLGVLLKQSKFDMTRFGIGEESAELPLQSREPDKKAELDLGLFIPAGFAPLSKMQVYLSDNLYEKINGKAPLYIESGFVKLFTHRSVSQADEDLWMELFVYDMATIRNAFSVYSIQKRPGVELLPDVQFGYRTSEAPYLVHGKYYVEFIASSESAQLFEAMLKVAQKIQTNLPVDTDAEIAELSLFPQEDLVPGSSKLYLESAFGFEGLTDTFAAHYKSDDQTITAFLSRRPNAQNAQKVAKSYHDFLIENGGKPKSALNKTLEGKVFDFYDTTEIVFATGPFVAGIHEAENQQSAENLAAMLANKLSEVAIAAPRRAPMTFVIIVVTIVVIMVVIIIQLKKKNLSCRRGNEQ